MSDLAAQSAKYIAHISPMLVSITSEVFMSNSESTPPSDPSLNTDEPAEHEQAPPRPVPSKLAWAALLIGSTISVVLDQWSKAWAATTLYVGQAPREVGGMPLNAYDIRTKTIEVASWFDFRLAGNKGAAWGIFNDFSDSIRVPFFVVLSAAALTFLLIVFYNSVGQRLMQTALTLIAGGAVGNLIDRIQIGYVIDFIDWHVGHHHWPVFNIADVSISVGVGLMIIDMFKQIARERALMKAAAEINTPETSASEE